VTCAAESAGHLAPRHLMSTSCRLPITTLLYLSHRPEAALVGVEVGEAEETKVIDLLKEPTNWEEFMVCGN
jgi:hypothetical protein